VTISLTTYRHFFFGFENNRVTISNSLLKFQNLVDKLN